MTVNGALAARVAEFEQRGYTILRGFNAAWLEPWRRVFEERYRRESGEDQRGGGVGQPRAVLRGLLQERPDLFLPALVAPVMLDLLEELMGPFVGFDSLQVAVTPPVSAAEARAVRAWHRDMWSLPGWTEDYLPPNAVNVLTYLQEGAEYGPLRVIPGSHRGGALVGSEGPGKIQAGEQAVELAAGDTVLIHSSLLHSTSGNYSGRLRIFVSYFYAKCWLPKRDAYGMESMQREIRAARARGDRRVARLFEPDRELLARRAAGDRGEYPERERWRRWRREERAERARGAAPAVTRSAAGGDAAPVAPEPELVLEWNLVGGALGRRLRDALASDHRRAPADHPGTGQPDYLVRVRGAGTGPALRHHGALRAGWSGAGRAAACRRPVPPADRGPGPPGGSVPRLNGTVSGQMVCPPSTTRPAPVMKVLRSRPTMAAATSSGVAARPIGVAARLRCTNSSLTVAVQRVSTRPGTTQLTCTAGA